MEWNTTSTILSDLLDFENKKAWGSFVDRFQPIIVGHARNLGFQQADAEDVVQNALIAIHRGRHTYRPERPFGPWVRTVVRNCVIDWFRERGRRTSRELAVEEPELFSEGTMDAEPGADELAPPLQAALQALVVGRDPRGTGVPVAFHGLDPAQCKHEAAG